MQKAIIIRNALTDGIGQSWSYEVDASQNSTDNPLRELLMRGWRVVQTCPLQSELDSCCLVIVEDSKPKQESYQGDVPLTEMSERSAWLGLQASAAHAAKRKGWDGETISLRPFGVELS